MLGSERIELLRHVCGAVHFARCTLELAAELRRHVRETLEAALRGIAWEYGAKK